MMGQMAIAAYGLYLKPRLVRICNALFCPACNPEEARAFGVGKGVGSRQLAFYYVSPHESISLRCESHISIIVSLLNARIYL